MVSTGNPARWCMHGLQQLRKRPELEAVWEKHHAFATFVLFPRGPRLAEYRAGKTLGLSQRADNTI